MSETIELIELEVTPIPPDTIASAREKLVPLMESTLHQAGREGLISNGELQIDVERPFPTDAAIIVGLTLVSGLALETYKALILPELKKRFEVRERRRGGHKSRKEKG